MEQSAGHEDSRLPLLKLSWEDTVYGIGLVQGCQVFPEQSWSVYRFSVPAFVESGSTYISRQ
jgi:hypothetical protein